MGTGTGSRLAVVAFCITYWLFTGFATAADQTAVAIHEPQLSERMTIWCLGNPRHYKVAAEALSIEVGGRSGTVFVRQDWEDPRTLIEWARSTTRRDVRDFNTACRSAFAAFREAEPQHGGGDLPQPPELCKCDDGGSDGNGGDESAIVGAVVGALLGGAGGLAVYRRRSHQDDADLLDRLDSEFQENLSRYIESSGQSGDQKARVSAHLLKAVLEEWHCRGREKGTKAHLHHAIDLLEGVLTGKNPKQEDVPFIGDLRGDPEALRTNGKEIHFEVAAVSSRIRWFVRFSKQKVPSQKEGTKAAKKRA